MALRFYAYRSTRFFLHMKEQVKYFQKNDHLRDSDIKKIEQLSKGVLPLLRVADVSTQMERFPASVNCHQHISCATSVTNIIVADSL